MTRNEPMPTAFRHSADPRDRSWAERLAALLGWRRVAVRVRAGGGRRRQFGAALVGLTAGLAVGPAAGTARAEGRVVHYQHSADMPAGMVAAEQLRRGGALGGYFQPVEVRLPDGGSVAVETPGGYAAPTVGGVKAGLLIGPVYQFKVTGLPDRPGAEVYPTVEVINRLYPPPGLAWTFPIPVHLTAQELAFALDGKLVTRVIYLEDPGQALPVQDSPTFQRYFEVAAGQDPLRIADQLGRPMAILRIGSRIPDTELTGVPTPRACGPLVLAPTAAPPDPLTPQGTPELDLRRRSVAELRDEQGG